MARVHIKETVIASFRVLLCKIELIHNIIINGNKTKNQEILLYPLLHNHPNTYAHKNANINLLNIVRMLTLLNNIIIQVNTDNPKYNLAGVQSLSKSVFII